MHVDLVGLCREIVLVARERVADGGDRLAALLERASSFASSWSLLKPAPAKPSRSSTTALIRPSVRAARSASITSRKRRLLERACRAPSRARAAARRRIAGRRACPAARSPARPCSARSTRSPTRLATTINSRKSSSSRCSSPAEPIETAPDCYADPQQPITIVRAHVRPRRSSSM